MKNFFLHLPLLLVSLTVTAFVLILYGYMYHAINASFDRAAVARNVVTAQKQNSVQTQSLLDLFQKTMSDRDFIADLFVADSEQVLFIEYFEEIGPKVGAEVELSGVSADDVNSMPAGSFGKIKAHVDAKGPWPSIMRTLMLSEVLPYQATLENVKIDSSIAEGKNAKRTWHLTYDIVGTMMAAGTSTKIK